METLLLATVVGTGYVLSKDGKNNRKNTDTNAVFKEPSQNSIYSSNYINKTRQHEKDLGTKRFHKSRDPMNTNIIPRQLNNNIINDNNSPIKYLQKEDSRGYQSALSGEYIDRDTFTKKTKPFFGAHIRQSNVSSNNNIVSNHTGVEQFSKEKTTPVPLFEPTKDTNFQSDITKSDDLADRYVASRYKKLELPFEQVTVGPGMDDELASPSGGFHPDVREHVMPKTIDELRPKTNPQISYKGRVVPGKAPSTKSESVPVIAKNRPETSFVNNPDKYFVTAAGNEKAAMRPFQILKETSRKCSKAYTGSAGPAEVTAASNRSLYKKSTKVSLDDAGPRNLFRDGVSTHEMGKTSYNLGSNERDITGKRTHTSNITTVVKSIISPILDAMKPTKKQNVEANSRQTGNFGSSNVSKNVVWDPNDIAKTTIKETNIHDNRTGNVQFSDKGVVWDPDDVTKTTIRETTTDNEHTGHMNSNDKGVKWDPNDIAKTTIKETNIHDNRTGNMITNTKGTVLDYKTMKFKTTIRETLGDEDHHVNMRVVSKNVVKDPNDIAKTTIKETNIHDNRTGNLSGPIKLAVYDPNDVARTTIKETSENNSHIGHLGGISSGTGYLTNDQEAPNTHRQFTSDYEYEGIANIEHNGGLGYITNETEAPNTNRQFTADNDYSGSANSMYKKTTSYTSTANMRTSDSREKTLKGRRPSQQGSKLNSGSDRIELDIKKIDGDRINTREITGNKVYNSIPEINTCSITQEKNKYNYKILDERIDPGLLNAFNDNPYTQPLHSYS